MHLLVREQQGVDLQDMAEDLGHAPADVVFLSFSDSDLLAMERAYARLGEAGFSLQLVNLARLRHPMSVDLYVEQTIAGAKCVVVRLLGGLEYWRYGVEEVAACCARGGIALALLPSDGRDDARLAGLSRVQGNFYERLDGFFREGGPENSIGALRLMAYLGGHGTEPVAMPEPMPGFGSYRTLRPAEVTAVTLRAVVVFYRAQVLAGDTDPIDALAEALCADGAAVDVLYVGSLKAAEHRAWVRAQITSLRPHVILNATFFAARGESSDPSPLEAAGCPILQILQPTSTHAAWRDSTRGLSQSDLAMQVVLPELDGRLIGSAISFKSEGAPGLPARHVPHAAGIAHLVAQARGWAKLSSRSVNMRSVGVVLSDYPGATEDASGQVAHAVGLDGFASLGAIVSILAAEGYEVGDALALSSAHFAGILGGGASCATLSLSHYRDLFRTLPEEFRTTVLARWCAPENDPAVQDGYFRHRAVCAGRLTIAVQPDRGSRADRKATYHDAELPPCHAYIAFYLWLRFVRGLDAMVHLGAHGTLEWLPGKAVALSESCAPRVLLGGLPVIYPFIVNNPGEAAAAKRRLGAVMIGHLTPPLKEAGLHGDLAELEHLIDEFASADGMDRRRGARLRRDILLRAADLGVLEESSGTFGDEDQALAQLEAYLCDIKDMQIRDGLHVFGQHPAGIETLAKAIAQGGSLPVDAILENLRHCADAEAQALLDALDGRFVEPGPAGAPSRGRADVLPTGRNLFTIDPRTVPTRAARDLAREQTRIVLERHLQDEGEPLRRIVIDLWGSASLRTGGEDLALALLLMGVEPLWDASSGRVCGIEITPLAALDRPRVDVTLRISGLFRDAFPAQIALFDQAVQAVAAREETADWNPLAASVAGLDGAARHDATARIFGAAPGSYGAGIERDLVTGAWSGSDDLGRTYLDASGWAYGGGRDGHHAQAAFAALLRVADAVLHTQDHAEIDVLESPDIAAHLGGLAVAATSVGAAPALWHADSSQPGAPKLRDLKTELARVVRARLTNPAWIAGMQRHGYAGAATMARGVDALCGFAATVPFRLDRQFDQVFAALLADEGCARFLQDANPHALAAMRASLSAMIQRGLWHPRGNSTVLALKEPAA